MTKDLFWNESSIELLWINGLIKIHHQSGQHTELPWLYSNEHPESLSTKIDLFLVCPTATHKWKRWEEGKKLDLQEQRLSGSRWRSASSLSQTSPQAPCLVGDGAARSHTYKQSPGAERNHAGCHHSLIQSPPSVRFNSRTDVPQMAHAHQDWWHIPSEACSSATTRHQM